MKSTCKHKATWAFHYRMRNQLEGHIKSNEFKPKPTKNPSLLFPIMAYVSNIIISSDVGIGQLDTD